MDDLKDRLDKAQATDAEIRLMRRSSYATGRQVADMMTGYRTLVREALARIEELEALTQWQDIETAPKDGTEILLSNPTDGYVETGHFISPFEMIGDENDDTPDWFTTSGEYLGSGGPETTAPTHWMPLPAPPQNGESA